MDRASTHCSSRQRPRRIPIWPRQASHNNNYISSFSCNIIISSSKCNNHTNTRVTRRRPRASSCSKCPTTFRSGKILGWRKRGSWGRRSLPRWCSWWIRGLARGSCQGRSIMSWVLKAFMRVAFRQIHSIIDSCLNMSDHVPKQMPSSCRNASCPGRKRVRLHEVRLGCFMFSAEGSLIMVGKSVP